MLKSIPVLLPAVLTAGLILPATTTAQPRGDVKLFAILPERVSPDPANPSRLLREGHPEGLTADADGNVYAATFETAAGVPNFIYVFSPLGTLKVALPIPEARAPLGMVTDSQYLYVNDVLNGDVLRYELPVTEQSQPQVYNVCGGFLAAFGIGEGEFCALNANDIGPDGRLYMSDNGAGPSFVFSERFRNGRLFVLDPDTGASSVWFDQDTRGELDVAFASFPEFGVNGIAFSNDGSELYMANMSTDVIYRMSVRDCATACQPSPLREFVRGNGINGPDNIAFDGNGILWIASGQNDRVVAVNPRGRIIAKIGTFEGFSRSGAPQGLLQPSGIVVVGDRVYVGNEASRGLRPTPDLVPESEWQQLRLFTISVIRTWEVLFGEPPLENTRGRARISGPAGGADR